jgi:hypothetical protein
MKCGPVGVQEASRIPLPGSGHDSWHSAVLHTEDVSMSRAVRVGAPVAFGIVFALSATMGAGPARAEDPEEQELAIHGEFEIGNDDVRIISRRREPTTVRVCVDPAKHTVPLKVTFDQKQELILPGNCSDVSGAHISLAPGARLDEGYVLLGKWTVVGA